MIHGVLPKASTTKEMASSLPLHDPDSRTRTLSMALWVPGRLRGGGLSDWLAEIRSRAGQRQSREAQITGLSPGEKRRDQQPPFYFRTLGKLATDIVHSDTVLGNTRFSCIFNTYINTYNDYCNNISWGETFYISGLLDLNQWITQSHDVHFCSWIFAWLFGLVHATVGSTAQWDWTNHVNTRVYFNRLGVSPHLRVHNCYRWAINACSEAHKHLKSCSHKQNKWKMVLVKVIYATQQQSA